MKLSPLHSANTEQVNPKGHEHARQRPREHPELPGKVPFKLSIAWRVALIPWDGTEQPAHELQTTVTLSVKFSALIESHAAGMMDCVISEELFNDTNGRTCFLCYCCISQCMSELAAMFKTFISGGLCTFYV